MRLLYSPPWKAVWLPCHLSQGKVVGAAGPIPTSCRIAVVWSQDSEKTEAWQVHTALVAAGYPVAFLPSHEVKGGPV